MLFDALSRDPSYPMLMKLISRPKLGGGPGTHFGILAEFWDGRTQVFDLVQHGGFGDQDLDGFLQGHPCTERQTLDRPHEVRPAWDRLVELCEDPDRDWYRLADWNCEHVARFIVTGRWESAQIRSLVTVGIAATLMLVLAKAG